MKYLSLFLFIVLLVVTILFTIEVNYWKQKAIHYAIEIKYIHKLVTDITKTFDFKIKSELIYESDTVMLSTGNVGDVYWGDSDTVEVIYIDSIFFNKQ